MYISVLYIYTYIYIYLYIYIYIYYNMYVQICKLVIKRICKLMKHFKVLLKDLFQWWNDTLITLLLYPYQHQVNTCYLIYQIYCCPGNNWNLWTNWHIKYFRWDICCPSRAWWKTISFIKQLCCKFSLFFLSSGLSG